MNNLRRCVNGMHYVWLCCVTILVGGCQRASDKQESHQIVEIDFNSNGVPNLIIQYDGDLPVMVKRDRNQDGRIDCFEHYRHGTIYLVEADDSFDGKLDAWVSFHDGLPMLDRKDADGDGIPDLFSG